MKKLFAFLIVFSLFLGFSTNVFADSSSSDKDYQEGLELIKEANNKVDKEIKDAVKDADELHNEFIEKVRGKEATKVLKLTQERDLLEQEQSFLIVELDALEKLYESIKFIDEKSQKKYEKEVSKLSKKITKLEEKMTKLDEKIKETNRKADDKLGHIRQDIEDFMTVFENGSEVSDELLMAETAKLSAKVDEDLELMEETQDYTKKLNKIIKDCFDETLEISNKALEKAAEKGVMAECSWKLVRFGHKSAWIDPLRIVGRY